MGRIKKGSMIFFARMSVRTSRIDTDMPISKDAKVVPDAKTRLFPARLKWRISNTFTASPCHSGTVSTCTRGRIAAMRNITKTINVKRRGGFKGSADKQVLTESC